MVDLVLVDPPVTFSARLGKLAKAGSFWPSLGLGFLASVTREEGFSVKIIDANARSLFPRDLVKEILSDKPRWVGISATTLTIATVGKIATALKKRSPSTVVIVGGAHLTAVPNETLKRYPGIDIGVIGEGEETLKELLKALDRGGRLRKVKGLILRDGKNLTLTAPRPFIQNLDELPLPAWDLFFGFPDIYRPSVNTFLQLPAAHLFTSRGCTGRCTFCDRSIFGRFPRMHSARRVLEMTEYLVKNYGIREIQFYDDNFLLFPQRLEEICRGLKKKNPNLTWSCQARADMINQKNLKLLKKAGCWQIGLGIESGSEKILTLLKKGESKEQLRIAIEWAASEGIEVKGFFILGNPGETKTTLAETKDFVNSLPLTYVHTTYFTPYPGSEAYHQAEKFGQFKFKNNWSKIGRGTIEAVFVPHGLTKRYLEKKASQIFQEFYFRPKTLFYHFKKAVLRPQLWPFYLNGLFSVLSFTRR